MDKKQAIGARIKELREAAGLKQHELERLAGLSPNYLSPVEKGKETPRTATLERIASALHVKISDILDTALGEGIKLYDPNWCVVSGNRIDKGSAPYEAASLMCRIPKAKQAQVLAIMRTFIEDENIIIEKKTA